MTVDANQAPDSAERPQPAAMDRHVRRMRRLRWYYLGAIGLIIAAAVGIFAFAWTTGEISHATLRTAAASPTPVPSAALSPQLTLAWRVGENGASGQPEYGGIVVTYSNHTVSGRDARTGARRWSYTRTDVTVCAVSQYNGRTVAIFDKDGNCDQMTALATATGARQWYRTLTDDGHPQIQTTQYTILLITPAQVHSVDPGSGYDRWNFIQPAGCHTTGAALGSSGVLIGQQCGDVGHLILRDPYAADDEDQPDKPVKWRVDRVSVVPVAADDVIAGLDPSNGTLVTFAAGKGKKGKQVGTLPLSPTPSAATNMDRTAAADAELIFVNGQTYAIHAQPLAQRWTAATVGPVSTPDSDSTDLAAMTLYAPTTSGIAVLDGRTGSVRQTFPVPIPSGGATIARVGSGFVVAGSSTAVYR